MATMNSSTTIDEIADGIYRIFTPVPPEVMAGGFSFNQYLIADDKPMLYHTGPRRLYADVSAAVERVLPLSSLAYIGFSHVESDECGALNEFLAAAPRAVPVCSEVAAMVSINDLAIREAKPMADGEVLELGRHRVRWFATPHLPHGWECAMAYEETTRTLLCGDLFTQPGHEHAPVTEDDILEPSEAFRLQMDYFAHSPDTRMHLRRLSELQPSTLACMHGSAWRGNGAMLLQKLAERVSPN
ncbi:MAG TPA: FprA family A-type flavoprotein [Noviherbaspirillum sp.]|uniref:FprA family A-type flavoprotein n=1 Tax=Noviherbaspirillum sp. TaxID=1926288 RepID=UPI002D6DFD4F|nr:FprA family A-type flavoprotein [Noviherbaspirillum sp.]HYD94969.1 FprA family A-type flavoprotein [Noviherbaspirillum sp.]